MKLPNIDFDENRLVDILKDYRIKEAYLFGSILTDSFHDNSDIDIMISYFNNNPIGLFELYEMKEKLKSAFSREIDIVEKEGIRNPYRRKEIFSSARLIYAA